MNYHSLKSIQWEKLKELIEHCYNSIPYYKELFDNIDLLPQNIRSLEDFKKIPILTKEDIRANYEKLIDPSIPEYLKRYDSTSGSTGLPLKLLRSQEDQEYGFALRYRSNNWCGWSVFDKSVWFVSDSRRTTELESIKGRIRLFFLNRIIFSSKNMTNEAMFDWAKQIKQFKPKQVYGYSSLLAEFAKFIIDNNIKIKGVKGVFSTSEVLRERELIAQAFNAPVYDQYGASEVPCIAHECKKGKMHLAMDEVIVEFEDIAPDSDIKKMIITPLYLKGMPLLRYEIKDAGNPVEDSCDCGLPYPVMELKVGRITDNLITKNGKIVSSTTLSWYITDATKELKQYELLQEDTENIYIKMVCDEEYRIYNQNSIKVLMAEMLDDNELNIIFEYVDKILPSENGKYKPISSNVIKNLEKISKV